MSSTNLLVRSAAWVLTSYGVCAAIVPAAAQTVKVDAGFPGADGRVRSVKTVLTGPEPGLYVGGEFLNIGGTYIPGLARFDGSRWHSVGDGCPCRVMCMAVDSSGSSPVLYVAGRENASGRTIVAEYREGRWRVLADAVRDKGEKVHAIVADPAKPGRGIVIGGSFRSVQVRVGSKPTPAVEAEGIAAWDGTKWAPLITEGQRLPNYAATNKVPMKIPVTVNHVEALLGTVENGTPVIYAGAKVLHNDAKWVAGVARWDGRRWELVPGLEGLAQSLILYDDGSGQALFAGGPLHIPNNFQSFSGVWRRTDGSWKPVGEGLKSAATPRIDQLGSITWQGTTKLYATGGFWNSGPREVQSVAVWDGKQWEMPAWVVKRQPGIYPVGLEFFDVFEEALYIGGFCNSIGEVRTSNLARIATRPLPKEKPEPQKVADAATVDLNRLKYALHEIMRFDDSLTVTADRYSAALSNTGRVAFTARTKIAISVDEAAPLAPDNPLLKQPKGLPDNPHWIKDRAVIWENGKSKLLPGDVKQNVMARVCLSPNGKLLIGNELRSLGSTQVNSWDGARWQPLNGPKNRDFVIAGANDDGTLVGWMDNSDASGREALVIRNGKWQNLPTPSKRSIAKSINKSGLIAGQALDKFGVAQACLWKDEKPALLGTFGGTWSNAYAVNDEGVVVGSYKNAGGGEIGFIWRDGRMRPVGIDGLKTKSSFLVGSVVYAINNACVYVGKAWSEDVGFIGSGEAIRSLSQMLTAKEWAIKSAIAINDGNEVLAIAVKGIHWYLVLLRPE